MSVLLLDADKFKQVNDQFGHHVGDRVLQAIASKIRRVLRGDSIALRWGGEEFAILLPHAGNLSKSQSEAAAATVIQRLLNAIPRITQGVRQHGREGDLSALAEQRDLSVSGGAVTVPTNINLNFERLIEIPDKGLYQAKDAGRNRAFRGVEGAEGSFSRPVSLTYELVARGPQLLSPVVQTSPESNAKVKCFDFRRLPKGSHSSLGEAIKDAIKQDHSTDPDAPTLAKKINKPPKRRGRKFLKTEQSS